MKRLPFTLAGVLIGMLAACGASPDGSVAEAPPPRAVTTAVPSPTAEPPTTPVGAPPAAGPTTSRPPSTKPPTSKPPTSKPPASAPPTAIVGELALTGPASCDWVPHALLDGSGGVAIHVGIAAAGLSGAVDITITALRTGNAVGRNVVHLGLGDSDVAATVVTAAVAGSSVLSVALVLDVEVKVRQPSETYQDTGVVTVSVPSPRPSSARTLSCGMVQ